MTVARVAAAALACAAWAAQAQQPAVSDAAQIDLGRKVFTQQASPACAVCHTLRDAQADGSIGPDLNELQPGSDQVRAVLRDGSGAMPSFEGQLTPEQLEAVIAYVVWASRAP